MATGQPAVKVKAFAAMFEVSGNDSATSPPKPGTAAKPNANRLTKPPLANPNRPVTSTGIFNQSVDESSGPQRLTKPPLADPNRPVTSIPSGIFTQSVDETSGPQKLAGNRTPRNINSSNPSVPSPAQGGGSSSDVKKPWQAGRVSSIQETADHITASQTSTSDPPANKSQRASSKLNIPNVFQKNSEPEQTATSVRAPKTSPKPSIPPVKSISPSSSQMSAITESPKPTDGASPCSDSVMNMSPRFQDARANISNLLFRGQTTKFTFDNTNKTISNLNDNESLTFSIQETALGNANINDIPVMPKKPWTNKLVSSNKLNINNNSFPYDKNDILTGSNNKRYRLKEINHSGFGNSPPKPESLKEHFDFSRIQCKTENATVDSYSQESPPKGSDTTSAVLPPPPRPPRNDGMIQELPPRASRGRTNEESWPVPPPEAFRECGDGAEELDEYNDIAAVEQISKQRPTSLIPEYTEDEEKKDLVTDDNALETYDDVAAVPLPELPARNPPAKNDSGGSFASIQESSSECATDKDSVIEEEMYEPLDEVQIAVNELKKQEPEKKDKDSKRKEKDKLKQAEKDKKRGKENMKIFKITGDEEPLAEGRARDFSKGGKTDIALKKFERVFIMRMTDNPAGKWLVKSDIGRLGYVNSHLIEVMDLNYQNMRKSMSHLDTASESSVTTAASTGQDDMQDEDIYEDTS